MSVESQEKGLKPPASLNLESRPNRRPGYWLAALAVLMLAGAFRAVLITELPPGIIHDEVWNRLNVQQVLDGVIAPYYTQGGGREALYFFLQARSVAALGENLVAMRLPSVALGTALVALTVALGARLFNRAVGLLAALALASSFWAVLFSRLAVRNMTLPVVIALAAYTLYRALTDDAGRWGGARASRWRARASALRRMRSLARGGCRSSSRRSSSTWRAASGNGCAGAGWGWRRRSCSPC
ncbi:MAG: glycosyltransferase family 39 protein [Anaerolineae bacterium]|nr:glycosyltransferase family 39 protein [Anaerolineae bacterium]